jgi:hypothetical protein
VEAVSVAVDGEFGSGVSSGLGGVNDTANEDNSATLGLNPSTTGMEGSEGRSSSPATSLQDLKHIMDALRSEDMVHIKLYPPGKLVHIVDAEVWERALRTKAVDASSPHVFTASSSNMPEREAKGQSAPRHYSEWIGTADDVCVVLNDGSAVEIICRTEESVAYVADQLTFSELQLSADMFSSHLPTQCLYKLRELFPLST